MFQPTHILISRSRKTPVELIPASNGFQLLTEYEWQNNLEPSFEMRPKQGFFCKNILVVGYTLEPIATVEASTSKPETSISANQASVNQTA